MMAKCNYPTGFCGWGRNEHSAIARVIISNRFTMGSEVRIFEAEFATYHGRRHGIMVNSGSSANLIAVAALFNKSKDPLRPGDLAAVPALAWSTTYAPLVQHGMDLRLDDCDATWNAVPLPLPAQLGVACSVLGNPGYLHTYNKWREAGTYRYVIEDNCESIGAACPRSDRLAGTFGDLSTFSFFWSHQLSAIEGGMVLTDDDELADLCRMLRAHGWTRDTGAPESFEAEYDFRLMGYNVRPLEMHAAIAREQLRELTGGAEARAANLRHFAEMTRDLPITIQQQRGTPNPFGIAFTVDFAPYIRTKLAGALRANGVDCRLPTGGSFRRHPYAARWSNQATPNADKVHDTGMFLGNAPFEIFGLIDHAVSIIRETL